MKNKPILSDPEIAQKLRAELDSWIGTPWVHCGAEPGRTRAVKGIRGDCVHTLVAAFEAVRIIEPIILPSNLANAGAGSDEGMPHSLASILTDLVRQKKLEDFNPFENELMFGDILTFRFGGREHHVGVYKGGLNGMFYHSGGIPPVAHFMVSSLREQIYKRALRRGFRFIIQEAI